MGIRKKIVDGVSNNVLTDEELKDLVKQVELKKELHLQHDKLINSEVKTIYFDDFSKKHRLTYNSCKKSMR